MWNFCAFRNLCVSKPDKHALAASILTSGKADDTCDLLSGSNLNAISWDTFYETPSSKEKSLQITYKGGDKCASDDKKDDQL